MTVTFPAGVFTQAPIVLAQFAQPGSEEPFIPFLGTVSAAGFSLRVKRLSGTVWSTPRSISWCAVQAT